MLLHFVCLGLRLLAPGRRCAGIEKYGAVMKGGEKIYAYEVDGRGNSITDFDDANSASVVTCQGWAALLHTLQEADRAWQPGTLRRALRLLSSAVVMTPFSTCFDDTFLHLF